MRVSLPDSDNVYTTTTWTGSSSSRLRQVNGNREDERVKALELRTPAYESTRTLVCFYRIRGIKYFEISLTL